MESRPPVTRSSASPASSRTESAPRRVRAFFAVLSLLCIVFFTSCATDERKASAVASDTFDATTGDVAEPSEPVDRRCAWTTEPDTLVEGNGTILQVRSFSAEPVYFRHVLPVDSSLLAYRERVREVGGDVRQPELRVPDSIAPASKAIWRDEAHNNALVYSGEVGAITPISCLDALLFAEQNRRVPQLERPTEFVASVLRDERKGELVVVFGAGREMFPPKAVYGFDVVEEYVAEGHDFWYTLHNHTLQSGDGTFVLGVPAPSTNDVSLSRALAASLGLESVRVTNGFYTFIAEVEELSELRAR